MAFFEGAELPRPQNSAKIVIIGAGIAGLYAAYLAERLGFEVEILEASDRYGGRILPLNDFADFPIELGAEEIHGDNSIWFQLLEHHKAELIKDDGEELYFLDNQLLTRKDLMPDEDFRLTLNFVENLWKYEGKEDFSLFEYAQQKGIPKKYFPILESLVENTYGAPLRKIGIKSIAEFDNNWSAGERNFLLKKGNYLEIIEEVFAPILDKIRLNQIVQKINYQSDNSESKIKITTKDKTEFLADKVILTVPLPILKDGDIAFSPVLPPEKLEAIRTIGMDAGMKIILKFKKRFWGEDTGIIYGGRFAQQYWMTGYGGKSAENRVLTALICGERAKFLSSQDAEATSFMLKDLDAMFDQKASQHFEKAHIIDWYKEPHIRGLYSYPAPNSEQFRTILAQPIADKIFFAGEATNDFGHFATVHGAMETGYRAIDEILDTAEIHQEDKSNFEIQKMGLQNKFTAEFQALSNWMNYEIRMEIAEKMLQKNYAVDEISELTSLDLREIKKINN